MALSKKSNIGIIISVLVIIILIVGAFIFIYLTYDKQENKINSTEMIEMYVTAEDDKTRESINANYYLTYGNGVFLMNGSLEVGAYKKIIVPKNKILHFHCWNDNYYLVIGHKQVTEKELALNRSVFTCSMYKMGLPKINGELIGDKAMLNLTSEGGWLYRLGVCFKWSAGILDVNLDDQTLVCENDTWKNYTKYYPENNTYDYLPPGQYKCENEIEKCEMVIGRRCKLAKMEIPHKYKNQVDYCTYLGKSLSPDESTEIELNIATLGTVNSLDYVKVIFIDHDRRYNAIENRFTWTPDFNDDDSLFIINFINTENKS